MPLIQRLKLLLRQPQTWVALGLVGLFEALFIHWFSPGLTGILLSAGVAAAVAFSWPPVMLRSREFAELLIAHARQMNDKRREFIERLDADLERLGAGQAREQLQLLGGKLDNLTAVLRQRLDSGEVTYARYAGTAEQVYLAALDNLQEIAVALTSVSTIDEAYIRRRMQELERIAARSEAQQQELGSLAERLALRDRQRQKVERLIGENEQAMTVLDNTAGALADVRMQAGHAAMSTREAIRELEQLAGRSGRYAA
ncbi:MAG TPA: hypothetical protein VIW02_08270 [Gammaproteobacteria bacterium]